MKVVLRVKTKGFLGKARRKKVEEEVKRKAERTTEKVVYSLKTVSFIILSQALK